MYHNQLLDRFRKMNNAFFNGIYCKKPRPETCLAIQHPRACFLSTGVADKKKV